jgi:hypothetical protein
MPYVVGYRKKGQREWGIIGMPFKTRPTKTKLKRMGFDYMWSKGNEFRIQKLKKVI